MVSEELKKYSGPSPVERVLYFLYGMIDKPVVWFREKIVLPNRQEYYYYHEKIRRVPTVDECYDNDVLCQYEANQQLRLDRGVDMAILNILRNRHVRCTQDYAYDKSRCDYLMEYYEKALTNFFIKYGDLGFQLKARDCYMKQKHRMAWERRHGPVGQGKTYIGRKNKKPVAEEDDD